MGKRNLNDNSGLREKSNIEILEHMTRAEIISELMLMLSEVKDEDMLAISQFILQVTQKNSIE